FAIVTSDPEVRSADIRIMHLEPARPATTTVPQYRAELVSRLGQSAMNRRMNDKTGKGGTSYLSCRVSAGNQPAAMWQAELSARPQPGAGKWKDALAETAMELQRARAFGFTNDEIEEGRKQMMSGAERAVETESTQPMSLFMSRLNGDVTSGEPS